MGLLNAPSFTRRSSASTKHTLACSAPPRLSCEELIHDEEPFSHKHKISADDGLSDRDPATPNASRALPRRWIPKKKSGLFASFNGKRNHCSSSRTGCTSSISSNSDVDSSSSNSDLLLCNSGEQIKETLNNEDGGSATASRRPILRPPIVASRRISSLTIDAATSEDDLSELLQEENDDEEIFEEAAPKNEGGSMVSSSGSFSSRDSLSFVLDDDTNNDLDLNVQASGALDSETMLAELGDSPSPAELANVAAVRAKECINECLYEGNVDRRRWESIPQYSKADLAVRKHLGKGSFSDAFEVSVAVTVEERRLDSSDKEDLDRLVEAKFATTIEKISEGEADEDDEGDDLDREIDAMFAPSAAALEKPIRSQPDGRAGRRPGRARRQTTDRGVCASFCVRGAQSSARAAQTKQVTYAMKCLRPQIRSDAAKFIVGVEDLVHETAMLAGLDHPNIIKLHGRAVVADSFRLSDGYFILLDRLEDTLEDRIARWRNTTGKARAALWPTQLRTACSIADALSHLHSRNVVFRDLKPANVGFDSGGVLKLFDFGFAVAVEGPDDVLYDVCGTPRYMAPEVGLERGYDASVDVHSFGVLLWEILSLKKPFGHVRSAGELRRQVFEEGMRPKLARAWHLCLKELMRGCWSVLPEERPAMEAAAQRLRTHAREASSSSAPRRRHDHVRSLRKSSLFRSARRNTME